MIFTTSQNPNYVLPCLSGRTAFDLYLRAREFQPGSEIIMSAINIPDMVAIVQNHGLRVIPLDIDIDTLIPKYELIPQLVTHRTVAIVLAHLYGTTFDINPMITMAHQYNLLVIEDCAEAFGGFDYLGHPESDLSLFSFGLIKSRTAFGGCVAKVKDSSLFQKIVNIYDSDPCQTNAQYLKKLIKYFGIYFLLNASWFMRPGMWFCKAIKWDYQESVVNWVRGYPDSLLKRIRLRPSEALLKTMVCRLSQASEQDFVMARIKGRYVTEQISDHVRVAGASASQNNFWLFPVVVVSSRS